MTQPTQQEIEGAILAASFSIEAATLCGQDYNTIMNHQTETLIRAAEMVQGLQKGFKEIQRKNSERAFENRTLHQQVKTMREALEFYAETENYELMELDDMGTCASKVELDEGDKAKSTLAAVEKEKT